MRTETRGLTFALGKGCSVYLKQIELENFKSFGGRNTIPLMEGYLAVTGPNGSGKSNIADAILFVLGPKSSKAIRAGKLTDLLFDGGKTKEKADFTKVSLVFDNTDRMIPWDEDIVKLTRHVKMSQDGEGYSSYFYVNEKKSSMTEFDSLLMRARISADGYNLVQQGDVTRIVQMGALERRRILDNISGIASFDADIDKAKGERTEAETNLDRVNIIVTELDTQIEQLEKDMVAARKYLEAQRQMEMAKAQLVHRHLETAESELNYTKEQIVSHNDEIEKLREKKEKLTEQIFELGKKLTAKENEIEAKIGPEYRQIKTKIEDVKIRIATIKDRTERNLEDIEEQETAISECASALNENSSELEECVNALARIGNELADRSAQLETARKDHERLRKDISSAGGELTAMQTKLQSIEEKIDRKAAEEHDAQIKAAKAETLADESAVAISSLEEQIQSADFEIKDAEWNLKETKDGSGIGDTKSMTDRILASKRKESELEKQEAELNGAVNRLTLEYERLRTEKRVTENLSQGSAAVAAIISLRDRGAMKGIHGTVMELATVDHEWETALSVAAGGKMQGIVVDNDQVAADCINYLKREKLGRVTFLPLDKMMEGKPRARAIMIEKDTVGYAIDLMRFDERYRAVFWYVLGDTMVVDTLDEARRLMGGVRLVTKTGELLEASGAMVGGTLNKQAAMKFGPASESQMDKIGTELRAAADALEALKQQLRTLRSEIRTMDDEFRSASGAAVGIQGQIGKLEAQLNELREKKRRLVQSMDAKRQQYDAAAAGSDKAKEELQTVSEELESLRSEKSDLRERIKEAAPADIQERLQRTQDALFDLETEVNRLSTEKATANAEKNGIETRKETTEKQIAAAKRKISEYQAAIETADENVRNEQVELDALKKIEEDMESNIKDLRDEKDEIIRGKYETENTKNSVTDKMETKQGFVSSLEAKILISDENIKQLKQEISELDIEAELPIPSEQELQRTLRSCENVMAKIGNVNLRAIEDYDEKKERRDKLSGEVETLSARIGELTGLMDSLNAEKTELFMRTYNGVNENFRTIYEEMSGGGEGFMKLESPDSPFDGGLMINAKPKNGKMLRLEALSGGEKSMTALAFIFAIQEHQPSPFYMLDEVDAALDLVNAELVARRVKKSSANAQFIQVSHRKVTLVMADHLFGVTRQPNGISKVIVQPDLAEISKYEEEAERKGEQAKDGYPGQGAE